MIGHVLRKLGWVLALLVGSALVAYVLAATQLNPRSRYDGRGDPPPPYVVDSLLSAVNMNDKEPLAGRLGRWAGGVIRGDLGRTVDNQSVNEEISRRMWVSFRLMLVGVLLGTAFGIAAGAHAATKQYGASDRLLTFFSFVVLSTPVVVVAVLVKNAGIWVNGLLGFQLFLTTGEITPGLDSWSWEGIINRLQHLILPTIVLMMVAVSFYGRYQRSAMLDVLESDFLRSAQAKGLRRTQALVKHGLRTALLPMATLFSYQFALLFVGATFMERIFGWHGMGEYFVDSLVSNDVNAVAGVTLFVAVLVLAAGFLAELASAALDPRVRVE